MALAVHEEGYEGLPWFTALLDDPVASVMRPLTIARALGVAARIGLFHDLADGPVPVDDLADRHGLQTEPLQLMLDVLASERYLDFEDGGYVISASARRWLDPESSTTMIDSLSYSLEYWDWWTELDQIAVGGALPITKPDADDSVSWRRRVRAQFEWARMIGDSVADAIDLPRYAESILELGNAGAAHGWFSAVLCQRSPKLRATVIDEVPAVEVARELIWKAGLEHVVTHRGGDMMTAPLGGPYDAVFCLPLLTGLADDGAISLLRRIRSALTAGGTLITMRQNGDLARSPDPAFAWHELFLRLTSRADLTTPEQFTEQLRQCGFGLPRTHELPAAPELTVYVARAI
jgi:protein-L-isoaspartate O-methyltransferase